MAWHLFQTHLQRIPTYVSRVRWCDKPERVEGTQDLSLAPGRTPLLRVNAKYGDLPSALCWQCLLNDEACAWANTLNA